MLSNLVIMLFTNFYFKPENSINISSKFYLTTTVQIPFNEVFYLLTFSAQTTIRTSLRHRTREHRTSNLHIPKNIFYITKFFLHSRVYNIQAVKLQFGWVYDFISGDCMKLKLNIYNHLYSK